MGPSSSTITPPPNISVESLRWLAGCLEMRSGDRVVEEYRMDVRTGAMLGMGPTTTSNGLAGYELTLIPRAGRQDSLRANPSGQVSAVFSATSVNGDSVVFETPEHEYPRVVGYRRAGPDSVIAWIDGRQGGKRHRIVVPYRRAVCPGSR